MKQPKISELVKDKEGDLVYFGCRKISSGQELTSEERLNYEVFPAGDGTTWTNAPLKNSLK